jgi:hypothetical protein
MPGVTIIIHGVTRITPQHDARPAMDDPDYPMA